MLGCVLLSGCISKPKNKQGRFDGIYGDAPIYREVRATNLDGEEVVFSRNINGHVTYADGGIPQKGQVLPSPPSIPGATYCGIPEPMATTVQPSPIGGH